MATPFAFTDADADYAVLQKIPDDQVYAAAADAHRLARQAEARTVLLAARIFDAAEKLITVPGGFVDVEKWDKAAIGEISLHFGISRTKAGQWVALTQSLRSLPKVRDAYLDGEFTTHRTRLVCEAISELDTDVKAEAEPVAVELARRASADPTLRKQLSELVILIDPDAAADLREEFGARSQSVYIRDEIHGHTTISACVPAEVGVHIGERIAHLVAHRVCPRDPRRIGQQRAIALAELTQVPGVRLVCDCGDPQLCTVTLTDTEDPATTDAVGEPLGETFTDEAAAQMNLPPTPEPVSLDGLPADPQERDRTHDDLPAAPLPAAAVVLMDPAAAQVPWLNHYGPVDLAHVASMLGNEQATAVVAHDPFPALLQGLELDTEIDTQTTLVDLLGNDIGPPIDTTGHGGLRKPTKAARRYRPSQGLRERIFQSDRTCRYPFCSKPSDQCELDHIVAFNKGDPAAGGWTIGQNLAPLCKPDHDRKHLGIWIPTMHPDRVIAWHNPRTGRTILTYPR